MTSGAETLSAAAEMLNETLGGRVRREVPLAPMTTYRVGGAASIFVDVLSLGDLAAVASASAAYGLPVLVVGRGSNMLVADTGFRGIAVSVGAFAGSIGLDAESSIATAGGAVALPVLARRTAAAGLTGFEWAVGVPGSIGGAVRMNAGGHGSDMAASLIDVDLFDMGDSAAGMQRVAAGALGLRFRASGLAESAVVCSARIQLAVGDRAASEAEISEIVRWRREHQPGGQNCGSVFVNPVPGEVTAGGLIDGLGLRGFRIGSAWVSEKHANFVQAGEGGSADDVLKTIEAVRAKVAAATGYQMRSEVRLVGFAGVDDIVNGRASGVDQGAES